jgi:ubiquinone/menaquinone biosynthesis C-methylase UbiE
MYQILKQTIQKCIPNTFLQQNETHFRSIYAWFYKGKKHQCTVCKTNLKAFVTNQRKERMCPKSGSLDRDRRLWQELESVYLKKNQFLLDFSPSRCLARKLKKYPEINYKATDLSGHFIADYQYDITQIELPSQSLDLIICYHILEHIPDDALAMNEMFRILKSNGKAIIQTPFKEGSIYENPAITSAQDRLIHFGQEDHVRIYAVNGLKKRLENCGFTVEIKQFEQADTYYGLTENEMLLIASKP